MRTDLGQTTLKSRYHTGTVRPWRDFAGLGGALYPCQQRGEDSVWDGLEDRLSVVELDAWLKRCPPVRSQAPSGRGGQQVLLQPW